MKEKSCSGIFEKFKFVIYWKSVIQITSKLMYGSCERLIEHVIYSFCEVYIRISVGLTERNRHLHNTLWNMALMPTRNFSDVVCLG